MLLEEIREMRRAGASETSAGQQVENPEDPYVLQRLALATYKSKYPTLEEALKAARDLLKLLEPQTTNDTETLGLWGSVHKRLWELTKESSYLDEAVRAYERGFYLRNDYYNGINYAYLLNERAAHPIGLAEAVADFVQARRIYARKWSPFVTSGSSLIRAQRPCRPAASFLKNGIGFWPLLPKRKLD